MDELQEMSAEAEAAMEAWCERQGLDPWAEGSREAWEDSWPS